MDDEELLRGFEKVIGLLTPDPFEPNPSGDEVLGQVLLGKVRQTKTYN